ETADRTPAVAESGPVAALVPPGRVDASVVAAEEQVETVRRPRDCRDRCTLREHAADVAPVVVDAGPVAALVPPRGVDASVVAGDEQIEIPGTPRSDRDGCAGREEPADGAPAVAEARPVAAVVPPGRVDASV